MGWGWVWGQPRSRIASVASDGLRPQLRGAVPVGTGLRCRCGLRGWRGVRVRHDGGDEVADFLDLFVAPGGDEVEGDGLGGE